MGLWRKIIFTGRSLFIVAVAAGGLGWGAMLVQRSGLAWDVSGLNLGEARALVAELSPDSRVTVFGQSPLAPILAPLARGSERLSLSYVRADQLPLVDTQVVSPQSGDIQVVAGRHWLLLTQPDLKTVLWSLALVASPYAPEPVSTPPDNGLRHSQLATSNGKPIPWVASGVVLPIAVSIGGLLWRRRRSGR